MIRAGPARSTICSRSAAACRARAGSAGATRAPRPAQGAAAGCSPIGTPGSTMRGWSSSTPSPPPSTAPRSPPAPNCSPPAATARSGAPSCPAAAGRPRRTIVNAAGPWVAEVLGQRLGATARSRVRLVKGSHIVVPRLWEGEQAYILQQPDGRVVFALPLRRDFTLIGTTDVAGRAARGRRRSRPRRSLSVRGGRPLFHPPDRPRRRRLELFRRPRPVGRRRRRRQGRDPRLSSRARPGAGAETALRLRRQDHHRPGAGRGGARPARRRRPRSPPARPARRRHLSRLPRLARPPRRLDARAPPRPAAPRLRHPPRAT